MHIDIDLLLTWGGIIKKHKKNEILFSEGYKAKDYFQLIEGEIKMFNTNMEGKEFIQGVFFEGESFGEPPLFIEEPYPSTAITVKDSTIIKISRDRYFKILEEYPSLQMDFLKNFARRIYNKSTTTRDIINSTPEQRITSFLAFQKRSICTGNEKVMIPYTRQEIANFIGLRVETVIRTLAKMHSEKKVEIINRKLYY